MRLSISSSVYCARPNGRPAPATDAIRLCAQAGYQAMELNFQDYAAVRSAFAGPRYQPWLEQIAICAQDCGITFGQAHAPIYNVCDDSYDGKQQIDKLLRRTLRCAAYLNIPWVVIHAGTDFGASDWIQASAEKNVRYFSPLVDLAEELGIGIAIENLWDWNIAPQRRFTAQVEEVLKLVELLGSDHVGVCFDIAHAVLQGLDAPNTLRLIGRQLKATHVGDVINVDSVHLLPFQGKADWTSIMCALRDIDYQGDLTFEISRFAAGLPDAVIPAALAFSAAVGDHLLSLVE